ncbi:MAG: proline--tRNA ligase [Clostridiales bacterium]|jgi:prolyl-tRNA synthetase|nr:proline--tRNA ligase [Clostridiales bacterium]
MPKEKEKEKLVEAITDREKDFAQWYTDVVKKADLADYSEVGGCVIFRPYGYAIWELMRQQMDERFKATGHENVYMPLLITESLLQKEKDHVAGFAPEVAWITHGGQEKLTEKLCIRPTSETLFCSHYANLIQSYRDLPKLYNQWCSVVRWEKTTRPFLRTREFLWQEGHTAHATAEEAQEETIRMLNIYAEFCENVLAIPVMKGQKTESEKFAGAMATYTIESLMHDGKALQSGTTHNFGDGFARAFGIQYTDKNNQLQYVHQTSWGFSTRMIGGLIMVHGDNSGLVLPPNAAPVQVIIIPVAAHKEGVLEAAKAMQERLSKIVRVKMDNSDRSPGWRFSEHEMKGVPLRLEIGPKDLEKNQAVLVRRDTGAKTIVSLDAMETAAPALLTEIQANLLAQARQRLHERTYTAADAEEMRKILDASPGFVKAMWCGREACEDQIKEQTGASSRCIPFEQERISDVCVCCGEKAEKMVYWARAY